MTRQDFILKWLFYALATLPVWWLDAFVLNRVPLFGVIPMLLPVAAVAVAVQEGAVGGAGFGLAIGVLCDGIYYGGHGAMTLGLCLLCWGMGALCQYVLSPNFGGCVLCAALVLTAIDAGRVFLGLFTQLAPLPALLRVAVPEVLWSLVFVCPLYAWYRWVRKKIGKTLRLY